MRAFLSFAAALVALIRIEFRGVLDIAVGVVVSGAGQFLRSASQYAEVR
jgi:hypothetical protein